MARVRGKDTGPEMVVRRLVHRMGYRYRLHRKKSSWKNRIWSCHAISW
ncbi:hypothetical protein ACFSTD_15355 [Novosphingobium colocasiae]